MSIREAAPQIFRRPLLYVGPDDSIVHAATFLAIGPQIYADGLVVLDSGRLVGRIGGAHLARHILEKREEWLGFSIDTITEHLNVPVDANAPLKDALDIFLETRFAFVPVSIEGLIVASLSVRDLLSVTEDSRKARGLASPLKEVYEDMGIIESIRFMVENGIRDLVTLRQDGPYVINDRKILEFLLGHEVRQLVSEKGFSALDSIPLSQIGFSKGKELGPEESVGVAAKMLGTIDTPCIFVERKILTPWDVVMK